MVGVLAFYFFFVLTLIGSAIATDHGYKSSDEHRSNQAKADRKEYSYFEESNDDSFYTPESYEDIDKTEKEPEKEGDASLPVLQ